jgi:hypothetical protein
MKSWVVIFVVAATLAGLAGMGCASTPALHQDWAVVQKAEGLAEVSSDGLKWKPVRSGQKLAAGATLRTGPEGWIDLQLGTRAGVLRVHPDSTVVLEAIGVNHIDRETAAVLNLTRGRVTGDTLDLPPGMKIVVKTLVGMHEIR